MNELIKKGFFLGVGAALAGKEKLEENLIKLVEKGTMTNSEANSILREFLRKGEEKGENWNQEVKSFAREQLKSAGFVTKEELDSVKQDLSLLRQEIDVIRNQNLAKETSFQEQSSIGEEVFDDSYLDRIDDER
ncbi:phasin family protein [Mesobacillus zeae]|uniref:Polyhydroxyalkanoate synthesis regulator n=1 Tax=Mesobacillus zeae TaxID=1917180 RepID=A0A398B888_9BACI|nr:hypothetical protein [Mesobacillus zeae]RID85694.1 hypothetical protein D1970_09090 [Mesobacillus zeae]